MSTPPLPTDVAQAARTYLAAFLDAREVADAMHEVMDDASYWGDRDLVEVLAVAHAVLMSRQPVTVEVAIAALIEDAGLDAAQAAKVAGDPSVAPGTATPVDYPATVAAATATAGAAPSPPAAAAVDEEPTSRAEGGTPTRWLDGVRAGDREADGGGAAGAAAGVVRIGFEEEEPAPPIFVDDEDAGEQPRSWWLLGIGLAVAVLAILLLLRG